MKWECAVTGCNLVIDWRRLESSLVVIKPHFYVCSPAPQPFGSRLIAEQI